MQHASAPNSDQTYKHSLNLGLYQAMLKACTEEEEDKEEEEEKKKKKNFTKKI